MGSSVLHETAWNHGFARVTNALHKRQSFARVFPQDRGRRWAIAYGIATRLHRDETSRQEYANGFIQGGKAAVSEYTERNAS